jgi:predicted nucleotidyltransferase
MAHTYTSDVQVLIQFAKDQGWDLCDVMDSVARLEKAIVEELDDYSIPEEQ